jgi:hypothetical protein
MGAAAALAGKYNAYARWFTKRPAAGGAEWNERVHFPAAHADARGRTRDSRSVRAFTGVRGLTAGFGLAADFAALEITGRVDVRGLGVLDGAICVATRRFKPFSHNFVRLLGIESDPAHLISRPSTPTGMTEVVQCTIAFIRKTCARHRISPCCVLLIFGHTKKAI